MVKKVVLEGCNSHWAQEHYLPILLGKADKGEIELWAIDINDSLKLANPQIRQNWQLAQNKNTAHYLNKEKDKSRYNSIDNADFVFIVTPPTYHCQIAELWLERLSKKGKIFIEKPLDESSDKALELRKKLSSKTETVFCFDHYLASAYPFLEKKTVNLAKIGVLKNIACHILENNEVEKGREKTLNKGLIFDLFPHVLALVCDIVGKNSICLADIIKSTKLDEVNTAKYIGSPITGETFARVKFTIKDIKVDSVLGKCVGNAEDKWMKLQGTDGSIRLDFPPDYKYTISPVQGKRQIKSKLEKRHIERFLEKVLANIEQPFLAPGVLSFDAAFEILKVLEKARKNIDNIVEYPCKESLERIIERIEGK